MLYTCIARRTDHTLELLLDLGGLVNATDEGYWLKYEVKKVQETVEKPRGIKYSPTSHHPNGNRIFGIDNAHRPDIPKHPAGKSRRPLVADHMHKGSRIVPYEYEDAESLLRDFDAGVIATLKKERVKT